MADLTTIPAQSQPVPPQTDQKQAKPRKITKRVRHAVNLLITGECKTGKAAAERMKLAPEHLYRMLKEPHVLAYIEQQTRVVLAQSQAPAAATMLRLLNQAASEHVQKDVAIHLLGIAGHKPANTQQVSVNVDIKAGYVINLTPGRKTIENEP